MKTNHRRINAGSKFDAGFDYGWLMTIRLMRGGCSPSYTTRVGAAAAIRGRKKKDHRSGRHKANSELKQILATQNEEAYVPIYYHY